VCQACGCFVLCCTAWNGVLVTLQAMWRDRRASSSSSGNRHQAHNGYMAGKFTSPRRHVCCAGRSGLSPMLHSRLRPVAVHSASVAAQGDCALSRWCSLAQCAEAVTALLANLIGRNEHSGRDIVWHRQFMCPAGLPITHAPCYSPQCRPTAVMACHYHTACTTGPVPPGQPQG
jgi:hypothetical protein